ncbi:unnamed protein product [Caenorhabditis bovis]|uniref:Uncharacterized protein n=1 Tax=Caenorhabditis bovis TaxID=2654633 RepID=A0A8S1F7V9_9PELO|nr:unnamed protein product [Caenorhabditis bovis]
MCKILLLILAFFLPVVEILLETDLETTAFLLPNPNNKEKFQPAAVLLSRGCGKDLCINILLTLIFFLPGMIHACVVVIFTDDGHKD